MNFRRPADFSFDKRPLKWKKSFYTVSDPGLNFSLRPHKISLPLLSQESVNKSISPLPEPSPYLLKPQFQDVGQKKKKNKETKLDRK